MAERTIDSELKEQFSKFMESNFNYGEWSLHSKIRACLSYVTQFTVAYYDATLNSEEFSTVAKEQFGIDFPCTTYERVNMLIRVKDTVTNYIISLKNEN